MGVSWLHRLVGDLRTGVRTPVAAITISCASIRFPTVCNLQRHQRSSHLIPYLYGVKG